PPFLQAEPPRGEANNQRGPYRSTGRWNGKKALGGRRSCEGFPGCSKQHESNDEGYGSRSGKGRMEEERPLHHDSHQDGYHRNMKVSVAEAKNQLPRLIKRAESGERVTICRRGEPVADLVRSVAPVMKRRKLGTFAGKRWEIDPDWWKPMTEE